MYYTWSFWCLKIKKYFYSPPHSSCRLWNDPLQQQSTHMATCSLPPWQDEAENEVRKPIGGDTDGLISEGSGEREQTSDAKPTIHHLPQVEWCPPVSKQQPPWKATPPQCFSLGLGYVGVLLPSIMLYKMEYPFGQFGSAAQLHPQGAEEEKFRAPGRHCSATAKTLVGYQHHFSHKCKTQHHLGHCKEN